VIALDSDARRSYDSAMPVWRCPHCATPQAEASRCWVCHRSTTSCVTCRHYRRGISGGLGLCGLDPRHAPVADTDVRACWTSAPPAHHDSDDGGGAVPQRTRRDQGAVTGDRSASPAGREPRTFVPIETLTASRGGGVAVLDRAPAAVAAMTDIAIVAAAGPDVGAALTGASEPVPVPTQVAATAPPDRPVPGRWWLWGDPDPWPERPGQRWS
jgi:hypothetical protein